MPLLIPNKDKIVSVVRAKMSKPEEGEDMREIASIEESGEQQSDSEMALRAMAERVMSSVKEGDIDALMRVLRDIHDMHHMHPTPELDNALESEME